MPGRPTRQVSFLEQDRIGPAELRQVVEDGETSDAAANHSDLRLGEHGVSVDELTLVRLIYPCVASVRSRPKSGALEVAQRLAPLVHGLAPSSRTRPSRLYDQPDVDAHPQAPGRVRHGEVEARSRHAPWQPLAVNTPPQPARPSSGRESRLGGEVAELEAPVVGAARAGSR